MLPVNQLKGDLSFRGDPRLVLDSGKGAIELERDAEDLGVRGTACHHDSVESLPCVVRIEAGVLLDQPSLELRRKVFVDLHDFFVSRRPVELSELQEELAFWGLWGPFFE